MKRTSFCWLKFKEYNFPSFVLVLLFWTRYQSSVNLFILNDFGVQTFEMYFYIKRAEPVPCYSFTSSRAAPTGLQFVGRLSEPLGGDSPVPCLPRAGSEETQKQSLMVIICMCMFLVAFPWCFKGCLIRRVIPLAEKIREMGGVRIFQMGVKEWSWLGVQVCECKRMKAVKKWTFRNS